MSDMMVLNRQFFLFLFFQQILLHFGQEKGKLQKSNISIQGVGETQKNLMVFWVSPCLSFFLSASTAAAT